RLLLALCFLHSPASRQSHTRSLHDALPICRIFARGTTRVVNSADEWSVRLADEEGDAHTPSIGLRLDTPRPAELGVVEDLLVDRSVEHTSELQSRFDLVCRLLLEIN